jgi:hypothetical protein
MYLGAWRESPLAIFTVDGSRRALALAIRL